MQRTQDPTRTAKLIDKRYDLGHEIAQKQKPLAEDTVDSDLSVTQGQPASKKP